MSAVIASYIALVLTKLFWDETIREDVIYEKMTRNDLEEMLGCLGELEGLQTVIHRHFGQSLNDDTGLGVTGMAMNGDVNVVQSAVSDLRKILISDTSSS
jgi:hypothetical protein